MHTYRIALYFDNHSFAEEVGFKAPEGTDIDVVFELAAAEYEGYAVNNRPVHVGSVYTR
jgi:hypothetical protein